jgi:hypothetical protein
MYSKLLYAMEILSFKFVLEVCSFLFPRKRCEPVPLILLQQQSLITAIQVCHCLALEPGPTVLVKANGQDDQAEPRNSLLALSWCCPVHQLAPGTLLVVSSKQASSWHLSSSV